MKLHLGCGEKFIPGFVHVDMVRFDHIDHVSPIHRLPLRDNSVDLIYCCHALTYYDLDEIKNRVLPEWLRVLKPGGTLRISVTNLNAMIYVYSTTGSIERFLGPVFGRWPSNGGYIYHKTVFDIKLLMKTLEETGFTYPRRWDWRETEHSDIDDYSQAYYPHMDKKNGLLISLNLEADKPAWPHD